MNFNWYLLGAVCVAFGAGGLFEAWCHLCVRLLIHKNRMQLKKWVAQR